MVSDCFRRLDEDALLLRKVLRSNYIVLLTMPRFESSKMSYLRLAAAHLGIVMTIRSLKLRCYLFDQRRPDHENPSSSSEIHHLLSYGRPCVIVKSSGRWTLGAHTVSRSFSAVTSCPVPRELQPSHKKNNFLISLRPLPLSVPFGRGACCVIGGSHLAGLHGDLVEVSEVLTHDLGHLGRSGQKVKMW